MYLKVAYISSKKYSSDKNTQGTRAWCVRLSVTELNQVHSPDDPPASQWDEDTAKDTRTYLVRSKASLRGENMFSELNMLND